MIGGLTFETSMTEPQATCFIDGIQVESILALAGDGPLVDDANTDVILAFAECEIDIAILDEL